MINLIQKQFVAIRGMKSNGILRYNVDLILNIYVFSYSFWHIFDRYKYVLAFMSIIVTNYELKLRGLSQIYR